MRSQAGDDSHRFAAQELGTGPVKCKKYALGARFRPVIPGLSLCSRSIRPPHSPRRVRPWGPRKEGKQVKLIIAAIKPFKLEEVREALDKAAKLLQNDGLYAIGTEFNRGDILPLYDADNDRLLLYRKGLTAPTREQLAEMFGKYNGNAIYTPKLDPNNSATDGTVVEWENTPKYGLRSSEHTPVSAIADKLEIEYSGFKMVPTALPKHLQFKLAPIIEGMVPFGEVDIPSTDSKSNYKNLLQSYNSAFEFLGIDFRPDVAEVLLKDRSRASEVDNLLGNLHQVASPGQDLPGQAVA